MQKLRYVDYITVLINYIDINDIYKQKQQDTNDALKKSHQSEIAKLNETVKTNQNKIKDQEQKLKTANNELDKLKKQQKQKEDAAKKEIQQFS